MIMLILILLLAGSAVAQDSVFERHERFLSYLPDGAYILISYTDRVTMRTAGIVSSHPELFKAKAPKVLPFSNVESTYSYSAIVYDFARREREMRGAANPGTSRGPAPPGHDESMFIVEVPGLALLIDPALKNNAIADSGERIKGAVVYTAQHVERYERATSYLCSPEPDIILLSGSLELLRAMVSANLGEQPSFVNGDSYADLIEYAGDSTLWVMQLFDSINYAREATYLRRGEDPDKLEAVERMRSRNPLVRVIKQDYFEEEYREINELIFANEEAAENHFAMRQNVRRITPPANEEGKQPEEVAQFINKTAARYTQRREGNRVIQEIVYTVKDLVERAQLHKKYADYFKKIEKKRAGTTEEREKNR